MKKQRVFVKIKNFKSLVDIEVELKPLTFLFGSNAAGKSSFINAFKFFGHYISNVYNPDANTDVLPSYSELSFKIDENTDLGSFKEIVTNNDITKQIEFEITVKNSGASPINYRLPELQEITTTQPEHFDFNVKFVFGDAKHDVGLLKYITINDFTENLSYLYDHVKSVSENSNYYHFNPVVTTIDNHEEHPLKELFKEISYTPAFSITNSTSDLKYYDDYIEKRLTGLKLSNSYIKEQILSLFERIFILIPKVVEEIFSEPLHIPSLRRLPEKSYPLFNGRFDFWVYDRLLRAISEEDEFKEKINGYLRNSFGFDEMIDIKKETLAGCIVVKNSMTKTEYNLVNTSSGLLQLLPIIGLIIQEHLYKLFFCEQPELHLHPKLQTKLAEFFTDVKFKDRYKVIETHSEHIIRKIQVLIAQKSLNKEEVTVYYFDKKNGETKIKEMKLSERGLFVDDWPEGFFDEDTKLFSELFQAIHKN